MNTKSPIIRVLFYIFASISFAGFLILASSVDILNIPAYLLAVTLWAVCSLTALFLYDSRYLTRHLFAIYCVITLLHGYIHKIVAKKYQFLYDVILQTRSIRLFYRYMLYIYDVGTVRSK